MSKARKKFYLQLLGSPWNGLDLQHTGYAEDAEVFFVSIGSMLYQSLEVPYYEKLSAMSARTGSSQASFPRTPYESIELSRNPKDPIGPPWIILETPSDTLESAERPPGDPRTFQDFHGPLPSSCTP
jgi:hypothetical protein